MIPKRFIDIVEIEKYFVIEEDGAIWSKRKKKYMKPTFNTAGYLFISLRCEDGKSRMYAIHRLVATKYLGECPKELETSHKDGDKSNNHWSNLEYITHSQNILKSYREHGRVFPVFPRHALSDHTKELMSDAKKKRVRYTLNGHDSIFNSIETAAKELNTYRKKIYLCIIEERQFFDKKSKEVGGWLSFVEEHRVENNPSLSI